MEYKNKAAFITFIIFLLFLIVGGYFATSYFSNNLEKKENNEEKEFEDIRIDTSKDYFVINFEKELIAENEIVSSKIEINFGSYEYIEDSINNLIDEYNSSIVYESSVELEENTVVNSNSEGIYSLNYIDFETINFGDNLTLIVKKYSYDIVNHVKAIGFEVYSFDKTTGDLINEEDFENKHNKTDQEIKNLIEENLKSDNELSGIINVEETINNLEYSVYMNENGKVEVLYLVKSTKQDYYDKLEIN